VERIGLFGGSFDPIHTGHLLLAQAAIEELGLTRLCFILAAQSPFKVGQNFAPAEARLQMLRLALAGKTNCDVDEQEISRGGVSFAIDTVRDYARRFPQAELFYLIGADHVSNLPKWRDATELARLARFVVIPRPGSDPVTLPPPFHGRTLAGFAFGVSASQIRMRVKAGQTIEHLVPAVVAEAVRNNRLYL
jgi:nicotinate-nucleotide adenylyltransferase